MTADEVIATAQQAGYPHVGLNWNDKEQAFLMRFAALVAEAEREACAQVCESEWATDAEHAFGGELAALIRARGTQ